jgi:hypothetical protein
MDYSKQIGKGKGLDENMIDSHSKPSISRFFLYEAGHENERDRTRFRHFFETFEDSETVQPGHDDIADDKMRRIVHCHLDTAFPIFGLVDNISFPFKHRGYRTATDFVIIDHENTGHTIALIGLTSPKLC